MRKGIVASLALSGLLLTGPAALAAPADPVGSLPGHGLMHAGHDHGDKADKPKPKKSKDKKEHKDKKEKGKSSGAHASGGYDHHRSHSR